MKKNLDYVDKNIKHIFIVNYKAGNGNVNKFLNYFNGLTSDFKNECMFLYPINANETTEMAKKYSYIYPFATIYSVGGDGTLNNIVNGVRKNSILSILPFGSGNNFYRVCKKIEETSKIDIGLVNDRKFINIASIGIDTEIANDYKKNKFLKNYTYSLGIIKEILMNPYFSTNIGDITLLVAANGKYYGNGVPINPNCNLNDGKLEFYYAERLRRLQILKLFLKVYKEEHQYDKRVNYFQNSKYNISSEIPLICNFDGEIMRAKKFEFSVIPEYLTINKDIPVYIKQYFKKNKI